VASERRTRGHRMRCVARLSWSCPPRRRRRPVLLGRWQWCDARMGRPTQTTCSTAGPLCDLRCTPGQRFLSALPLFQYTPAAAFVQCPVTHTGAGGAVLLSLHGPTEGTVRCDPVGPHRTGKAHMASVRFRGLALCGIIVRQPLFEPEAEQCPYRCVCPGFFRTLPF
jgi:hypothetical protein